MLGIVPAPEYAVTPKSGAAITVRGIACAMAPPRPDLSVADAEPLAGHWTARHVPRWARPFVRLARLDRPIGAWLLLWPCWWSLALAAPAAAQGSTWSRLGLPDPALLALFALGALAMRGAGCVYNDIVDRDLDARVARTRSRPIPSGQVSVIEAVAFMAVLGLVGLGVLLSFNRFAVWLGLAALPLVVAYPFAKRVTDWPQAVLGLAFNWGALLGWAAVTGGLGLAPLALYAAGIAWTLGYDTIYALQDKEDDALIGVRSTALLLGANAKFGIAGFYTAAAAMLVLAGTLAGVGWPFYAVLIAAVAQLGWQVATLDGDDAASCLRRFRSNKGFGWLVFTAIVAGQMWS